VALYRLLESWGLTPDFLTGHSIGELSAAHCAGVLSLADACTLVSARATLMQSARTDGAMAAIRASEDEVRLTLTDGVCIAALNTPDSTVVAGDRSQVSTLVEQWKQRGRKAKLLNVSHAFHSHHMDGVLDQFHQIAATLTYHLPRLPIVSNVTGRLADPEQLRQPTYWTRQIREAVRFRDCITTLRGTGVTTYLELGPDTTLAALAGETLGRSSAAVLTGTLRPRRSETITVLRALAIAHAAGHEVAWPVLGTRTDLPTYAFQHRRYWLAPEAGGVFRSTDAELWGAVTRADDNAVAELLALPADQREALRAVLPSLADWHRRQSPEPSASGDVAEVPAGIPLLERLWGAPEEEQSKVLLDTILRHAAAVLGYDPTDPIDVQRDFLELGFSSFTALELAGRLRTDGLQLDPVAIYDHPTPAALADHLRAYLLAPTPENLPL
jgi:acyl transferase domain-containing protein